jgi:hypothetical protein
VPQALFEKPVWPRSQRFGTFAALASITFRMRRRFNLGGLISAVPAGAGLPTGEPAGFGAGVRRWLGGDLVTMKASLRGGGAAACLPGYGSTHFVGSAKFTRVCNRFTNFGQLGPPGDGYAWPGRA